MTTGAILTFLGESVVARHRDKEYESGSLMLLNQVPRLALLSPVSGNTQFSFLLITQHVGIYLASALDQALPFLTKPPPQSAY